MTWSTSDVAVCCSSDSDSSLVRCCSASNSRAFSIAITAWLAKEFDEGNLVLLEDPRLVMDADDGADDRVLADHRRGNDRIITRVARDLLGLRRYNGIADYRRVLHDQLGEHRLATDSSVIERTRVTLHNSLEPRLPASGRHFDHSIMQ